MATVIFYRDIAKQFTDGQDRIEMEADDLRGLIRALDERFPGLGPVLREDMAIAIDGQIFQDTLNEPIGPNAEVCFLPAIEGG